jgi:hypothetical protein
MEEEEEENEKKKTKKKSGSVDEDFHFQVYNATYVGMYHTI